MISETDEYKKFKNLFDSGGEFTAEEHLRFRDLLLMDWESTKNQIKDLKEKELQKRKLVVRFSFDPEKRTGTERIDLGGGYQLKAVKSVTYKVDPKTINSVLDEIEAVSDEGKIIADRIIKWKPELATSEYKILSTSYKAIIDKAVSVVDGSPTLEIISPKGEVEE